MKVWIVEKNSWTGETDSVATHKVFGSFEAADRYCKRENAKSISSYAPAYSTADDDGFEVEN